MLEGILFVSFTNLIEAKIKIYKTSVIFSNIFSEKDLNHLTNRRLH